ncbi:helix-turn-helix domain-containing protein [Bacteroides sp. 4_1_36]|uniref:helix-turn-helix domain-containing protein n=1 Tax=Bacteroides sp. 4_1_36 TaxID=457393 RepID=UPI001E39D0FB|nr:helix-turn-helix domain-containing protein [Bacteroides sp. 4_1_36]
MTTKIANILQCYALGMGIKQISRSFELSRNTVRRYVRLFQECGIPIKELAAMPSARIQECSLKVLAVTGNRHTPA